MTEYSLIGAGEVVLLPLDVLKIKRQTNPESFRGRGMMKIIADEGFGLYRGTGWTMARNFPGSFAVGNFASSGKLETNLCICSFSVDQQRPNNTSSNWRTTTKPHGHKISLLLLQGPAPRSSSPLLLMLSRQEYKPVTSKPPRVDSK